VALASRQSGLGLGLKSHLPGLVSRTTGFCLGFGLKDHGLGLENADLKPIPVINFALSLFIRPVLGL